MDFFSSCIALNGSSRPFGNTKTLLNKIEQILEEPHTSSIPIVDLCTLNITPYDYLGRNSGDDFLPLITRCIKNYSHIIFATPIYWYTVSAHTKIFLDRFTDLITIHKNLTEELIGKEISVVASFAGRNQETLLIMKQNVDTIFFNFCHYLKMHYKGSYFAHSSLEEVNTEELKKFFLKNKSLKS
ncbi:putative NAD(P)H-dependent FMN-containing oxidoreductase YwqN [Holospora undulata HU1]|uniref:Putative NAD(P)H-dependent FMN-containing oxidoreductase YwqN n=2 Tax=Holospora TaxID=44747 RepID=A0A061JH58_9PROT|nr:putative NAD(P)H-dependent FMN-containing oxidoreductase YwqN [Holospora undulata HU1]